MFQFRGVLEVTISAGYPVGFNAGSRNLARPEAWMERVTTTGAQRARRTNVLWYWPERKRMGKAEKYGVCSAGDDLEEP